MMRGSAIFFADAGPGVGLGHVFRAYALFVEMTARGFDARFLVPISAQQLQELGIACAEPVPDNYSAIRNAVLGLRPSILVLDTYRRLAELLRLARDEAHAIVVVFDDHYRISEPVNAVVNASPAANAARYQRVVGHALLGPAYASIHPSFRQARERFAVRAEVERVLVALGGADTAGNFRRLVRELSNHIPASTEVIALTSGPLGIEATPRIREVGWVTQPDLADLMSRSDLAVFGGGSMLSQAASIGLPVISWPQTPRQRDNAQAWGTLGMLVQINELDQLAGAAGQIAHAAFRESISNAGRSAVDGVGASRIAEFIQCL